MVLAVPHAFGRRDRPGPTGPPVWRPEQIHGTDVVVLLERGRVPDGPVPADAVVSRRLDRPVGVVTADCVPVLVADSAGETVAAIHAGWRGLAAGVIETALTAFWRVASSEGAAASIGPHIGRCCYEVDAPVLEALEARFEDALPDASEMTRPGHARIDLGHLAATALTRSGVSAEDLTSVPDGCTRCHADRYHSYRRDGSGAGRMTHWVKPRRGGA